jgi:hypothetical protein
MKAITGAKLNCVPARNSRFAFPKTLQPGFDGDLYRTPSRYASFKATFLSRLIEHRGAEEAILGGSRLHMWALGTSTSFTGGRLSKNRRLREGSRYTSECMRNADKPAMLPQHQTAAALR